MQAEGPAHDAGREAITRSGYWLIVIWAAAILILYIAVAFLGASRLREYGARANNRLQTFLAAATDETPAAQPSPDTSTPAPVAVYIGAYFNQLQDLSLAGSSWKVDFDIWFRWHGETVDPGERFQIINGAIESKEKRESCVQGGERYERYRVLARIVTHFDMSRMPFGGGALGIQIEDGRDGADRLRYVADGSDIGINPGAAAPGWRIGKAKGYVTNYRYPSRFGDPRLAEGTSDVRSRYTFGFWGASSGWGTYTKLFQTLFLAVAIALIAFFIKPIHVDPRFGLGIGAVFAAVGNNIFAGFSLLGGEGITLAQMVNAVGLITIFLTIIQSAVSLWIFDSMGRERLSRVFDRVCFAAFLVGYLAVNLALPLAAGG